MIHRRLIAFALAGTLLAVFATTAHAVPGNDLFANAETISGPSVNVVGTTVDASAEADEPTHAGVSKQRSVWYSWMAPSSGTVKVDTCGTGLDTFMAVYTGTSLNALTERASNDDAGNPVCPGGTFESRTRFRAESGTTYKIAVDAAAAGSFDLQLDLVASPANDDFANAQDLTGTPVEATGLTSNASRETGEPQHFTSQRNGASIWFDWTAPTTGPYRISTCGSNFNTNLAVYTGTSVGGLVLVPDGRNNDLCGQQSIVQIEATAAEAYRIAVDGHELSSFKRGDPTTGAVSLAIRELNPPGNDDFANAIGLSGIPFTQSGTTLDATTEAGETPSTARSVWYSWQAPASAAFSLSTCGSVTSVDVFTGNAVNALTAVPATGTTCDGGARTTFAATMDTTYRIRVRDTGQGIPFQLRMRSGSPAPNDLFENATVLSGAEPSIDDDNIASSADVFGANGHTVWYSWTPPAAGDYRARVCNANFVPVIGAFTGNSLATIEEATDEVAETGCDARFTGIEFSADGTEPIHIAVGGGTQAGPQQGEFSLEIEKFDRPGNDDFAGAFAMTGTTASSPATTQDASVEASEPFVEADNLNSNWHSWTAPASGEYRLSTCGGSGYTFLVVYSGTALSDLEERQSDISGAGCGPNEEEFGAKLIFDAQQGVTYWFQVLSLEGELEGAYTLSLNRIAANEAPDTSILGVTVKKTKATAEFTGTDDGDDLTFECNLDGKGWKDCISPQKLRRLKRGEHELAVRAIDDEGRLDRTPAIETFKVKKRN